MTASLSQAWFANLRFRLDHFATGLRLDDIAAEQVFPAKAEQAALELMTLSAIEESSSATYRQLLVASGQAVPPEAPVAVRT